MSLATRCPACGTVFRVVRDQLKVSEGWVRCGRCSEVFNAGARLFELEAASAPLAASPPPVPAAPAGSGQTAVARMGAALAPPSPVLPQPIAEGAAPAQDGPAQAAEAALAADAPEHAVPKAPDPAKVDVQVEVAVDAPAAVADGAPAKPAQAAEADSALRDTAAAEEPLHPFAQEAEAPAPEETAAPSPDLADVAADAATETVRDETPGAPSAPVEAAEIDLRADPAAVQTQPAPGFVLRAERAARWRHPLLRAGMALLCLLLAATLAAQMALHYRDDMAARWPLSKPWLQGACQWLGCRVEPPRRIDSVAVESSGLVRVEGSPLYRLTLVVQNRSTLPVRMPAIDLALTDAQGRTMTRRVLSAADLGQAIDSLPPQGEVALQAMLELGERRIAGYTVELFYP